MSALSSEHHQLLLLWGGGRAVSTSDQLKASLPNKVTTPNRGPLSLNVEGRGAHHNTRVGVAPPPPTHHHHHHHRNSLTRFPVKMIEKPMEVLEKQLGTLSCAQLKNSLQVSAGIGKCLLTH